MKNAIKIISIVMVLLMCTAYLAGCERDSDNSRGSDKQITSSSEAISAVKNYLEGTSYSLKYQIARSLGFNDFYDPQYSTSSATQNSDASWSVTIKGTMMGYVDEYNYDLETYKFEVSATVSETGNVRISVRKVS